MRLRIQDMELWYEVQGNGPPIVLLHGNGEDHRIFDVLTGPLSATHTVYALDSRCHGQSGASDHINYDLMAQDVHRFIQALHLEKPVLYGFSDGGIIGLLLASRYPDLLSGLIISGANSNPAGLKTGWRLLFTVMHFFKPSNLMKMMLKEPDISPDDLAKITIPTLVLAGEKDMIKESDTRFIARHISRSTLKILTGENHQSYVVHSPKLYDVMKGFLGTIGPES